VLKEVKDLLDSTALTVTGKPLVDYLENAQIWDQEVIHVRESPIIADAGIAVLRGNLALGGAIIKPAAATPELLYHEEGRWSSTASKICTRASMTLISTSTSTRCSFFGLRTEGLSGNARSRQPADTEQASGTGRT